MRPRSWPRRRAVATLQDYCTALLQQAIEDRADSRRKWPTSRRSAACSKASRRSPTTPSISPNGVPRSRPADRDRDRDRDRRPVRVEPSADPAPVLEVVLASDTAPSHEAVSPTMPGLELESEPIRTPVPPRRSILAVESAVPAGSLSAAAEVVLRHAGQAGDAGPSFLANLRRGESVPLAEVAELARALHVLEEESRDASMHGSAGRLRPAPARLRGAGPAHRCLAGRVRRLDGRHLRAVQEAVDRILSGQDIRYYTPGSRPEVPL